MRDSELTKRAQAMRKAMTEPERRLWLELRAERFAGVKFRRQKVVQDETRKAIVDFAANEPKLVIEVDGDTHAERATQDATRTRFLETQGYMVLRFTNADVMQNMDGVLARIAEVISELRARPPLPTLSPGGGRARSPSRSGNAANS